MSRDDTDSCPLCGDRRTSLFRTFRGRRYFSCETCGGIHIHRNDRLDAIREKARYLEHNNDVRDEGYRRFVSPIVDAVTAKHGTSARGLDFGAGTGPVVSKILGELNYHMTLYDPYFHVNAEALEGRYDFIVCCEVIEHFYDPRGEFSRLKDLLQAGGSLYCMTSLLHPNIEFDKWYYKDDPTHVFFYREDTILWIKEKYGFGGAELNGRLIVFEK